ncbi:MAG: enoyl-CoA hydratase-related protein [Dehalococcoidia bacterium]
MDDHVQYETRSDGQIALISMARERYRNPLSQQMMAALEEAFEEADTDRDVRVIILRGLGPVFSAGHDLGSPDALATRAERESESAARRYNRTRSMDVDPHLRFRNIKKPTIAMVHGTCVYASWMLASAMDIVFAAEDSQFLATNFAFFTVPWDIGARRAKHLMFEGRFIDAKTAAEYGFVQAVYPPEDLERETLAYAARVAENDPFQLQMMKHSINQMQEVQGFTAHIMSSYSDRQVRAANNETPITVANEDPTRRRLYVSVERARKRQS